MYADDIVIFRESVDEPQRMYAYSSRWKLSVSIPKTIIVIFMYGCKYEI